MKEKLEEEAEASKTGWIKRVAMEELELVELLVLDERRDIVLEPSVRERVAVVGKVEVAQVVEWEEVAMVVEQEDAITAAPSGTAEVHFNHQLYRLISVLEIRP